MIKQSELKEEADKLNEILQDGFGVDGDEGYTVAYVDEEWAILKLGGEFSGTLDTAFFALHLGTEWIEDALNMFKHDKDKVEHLNKMINKLEEIKSHFNN